MGRNIWKRDRVYDIGRWYVDCCTRMQFSSVRIRGRENIPSSGAVILAPNHAAALMDPLVMLLACGHVPVGFGARSDIFSNPRVAKVLNWLRILPLARERNGLHEVAKNLETFDDIVDCLAHGVPFCMYSEGMHRAERGMLPVKKGIFRIARKALDEIGGPVHVVPIGVDYEHFFHEMGRLSVSIGEPIEVGDYIRSHEDMNDSEIYKGLCGELRSRILDLLDHIPERRHNMLLPRALLLLPALPLWLVLAVLSLPVWLPARLMLLRCKDKAWTHTIYFAVRFFLPVFWPFFSAFALIGNHYLNFINDCR